MAKKIFKRLSPFLLCALLIFGLAGSALADGYASETPGYIYAGSKTVYEASFQLVDGRYTALLGEGSLKTENAEECLVSFGDAAYRLKWNYYQGDVVADAFFIGNPYFLDPELRNTYLDFVIVLDRTDKTKSFISCTPEFFAQHIEGTGSDGVVISFSVPDNTSMTFLERIFGIFSDVGQGLLSLINQMISFFWNAEAGSLTFCGLMALIGLGISLSLLLIKIILGFLRFRN